jgi:cholest-4-en-3-one 26-monooxygenase
VDQGGKQAVAMTRLSCHRFQANQVRLWLSVIAYNLGNLWRRLARNHMIGSEDPEYTISEELVRQAQMEMFMYANALAAKRREEPRDDLVTTLFNAEINGDRLSEMDFNLFFLLLAVAGNETTRNALSHGVLTLIQHPQQYRMLVDDPSLVSSATEEILRWASPVMYFRRNVTCDSNSAGSSSRRATS